MLLDTATDMESNTQASASMESSGRDQFLIGNKEIARYCGVCDRTVVRWRQLHGFPACHLPDGRVATDKYLISQWLLSRPDPTAEANKDKREARDKRMAGYAKVGENED